VLTSINEVYSSIVKFVIEYYFPRMWLHLFGRYRGADKSLARPGREKATETEDFDVHISYLLP